MIGDGRHYVWTALNRFGVQGVSFFGNILIARKLAPEDFGLVATLSIVIALGMNLTDAGFSDCLIRNDNADKRDFDTIFVYNLTVGVLIYAALYFFSPYIALYFQRPELVSICRVLSLTIIFQAITITQITWLRKQLLFKKIALLQLVGVSVGTIVGIVLAYQNKGFWALVFQNIINPTTVIILLVLFFKWRPSFAFSWKRYLSMRKFGLNLMISYIITQVSNNIYSVVIGKFQSASLLGYYNQGTKINDSLFQSLNSILLQTSYPLIAKEKNVVRRKEMYSMILERFLYIQFFLSAFIIGSADDIIQIVFGDKWIATAPMLKLLVTSMLFYPLVTINSNIAKIEGKSKLYRNLTFLRVALVLTAALLTSNHSIFTMLIGQIVARYISVFFDILLCGKLIDFGIIKQLKVVISQIWIPFCSAAVALLCTNMADLKVSASHSFGVFLFSFLGVFLLLNSLFKNRVYIFFVDRLFKNKKSYV